jgi:hypothetical protein
MSCKGICNRHRASRPAASYGRYATGQKRCQICAIYMEWDGTWCPCCGCKVRTRPRNSKAKQKLKITRRNHLTLDNKETTFTLPITANHKELRQHY